MQTEPGNRERLRRLALLGATAAVVVALDQGTKWAVFGSLVPGDSAALVPGVVRLTPRANTGAAFSLFAGLPYGNAILLAVTVCVAAVLVVLALRPGWQAPAWAFGLLVGGAIANGADRLAWGHVRDFLDLQGWLAWWPTFNVADAGITLGAAALAVAALAGGRHAEEEPDERG